MQHCPRCKINIRGEKSCCPLCLGKVIGEPEDSCFKVIPKTKMSELSFIKVAVFSTVVINVLMVMLEILYDFSLKTPIIIMVASVFALLDIIIAFYSRANIIFLVTIQTWIIMLLVLAIDIYFSGFLGYSIVWVIPILFVLLYIATMIIAKKCGLHTVDYAMYIVANVVLSLLQLFPVMMNLNNFPIPALVSICVSLIYLAFVIVFRRRDLSNAVTKYMNM